MYMRIICIRGVKAKSECAEVKSMGQIANNMALELFFKIKKKIKDKKEEKKHQVNIEKKEEKK
ncbi:MAG: hypothetical protein RR632_02825 [Christensenella sp.]